MNTKRFFGTILTLLGIFGLIYTAVLFLNTDGAMQDIKALFVYGVLGIMFFLSGVGLIRTTKDEVE